MLLLFKVAVIFFIIYTLTSSPLSQQQLAFLFVLRILCKMGKIRYKKFQNRHLAPGTNCNILPAYNEISPEHEKLETLKQPWDLNWISKSEMTPMPVLGYTLFQNVAISPSKLEVKLPDLPSYYKNEEKRVFRVNQSVRNSMALKKALESSKIKRKKGRDTVKKVAAACKARSDLLDQKLREKIKKHKGALDSWADLKEVLEESQQPSTSQSSSNPFPKTFEERDNQMSSSFDVFYSNLQTFSWKAD